MKLNYQSKNQGLTLIEALIWFAVFAAVVVGVFALYSQSRNQNQLTTINKELAIIFTKMENLSTTERNLSTITNQNAYQLGIFPNTLKISNNGAIIKNIFGGDVTVYGSSNGSFFIDYSDIPTKMCYEIIRNQKKVGWTQINDLFLNGIKILPSDITNTCVADGAGSIYITFARDL